MTGKHVLVQSSPMRASTAAATASTSAPCHREKMRCPAGSTPCSLHGMIWSKATPSGSSPARRAFIMSMTGSGTVDVTWSTTDMTLTSMLPGGDGTGGRSNRSFATSLA